MDIKTKKPKFYSNDIQKPQIHLSAIAEQQIMAEAVRQCLEQVVLVPIIDKADKLLADLREQIESIKGYDLARCPDCGKISVADRMCDDLSYICPCCGIELRWKHHIKNDCYTLEAST